MKFKEIFFSSIDPELKSDFQISMLKANMARMRILMLVIIVFESILAAFDVLTSLLKVDNRFAFDQYLIAYLVMIVVSVGVLVHFGKIDDIPARSANTRNKIENMMLAYITFLLCWGSVISLMDQKLYGQVLAFIINAIVCSTLLYIEFKKMILPYALSIGILFIGLPFFQKSKDVLIGHYINLLVFIIIAFICSRIVYYNFYNDFKNKVLIEKMQMHLHDLSYLDELTKIPNRRSLNDYIESKSLRGAKKASTVSVIMIDVDFFKQFNDCYGHLEGDRALIEIAEQICRSADESKKFAARLGGEEFIYLAENQSMEQTSKIAEEIRKRVLQLEIPHEGSEHKVLSISLGLSRISRDEANAVYQCIEFADRALYKAKFNGRNCSRYMDEENQTFSDFAGVTPR